jgi:hypothetical protein
MISIKNIVFVKINLRYINKNIYAGEKINLKLLYFNV